MCVTNFPFSRTRYHCLYNNWIIDQLRFFKVRQSTSITGCVRRSVALSSESIPFLDKNMSKYLLYLSWFINQSDCPLFRKTANTCTYLFIHNQFIPVVTCTFLSSSIHSFIRLFIHSFIHSFVHSFINSLIHSFVYSFIHSPIISIIFAFIN